MNALVIGASSGLGRALCEELARKGHSLFLVSSDERDLVPLARDLSLRFDVVVRFRGIDVRQLNVAELQRAYREAFSQLHGLFVVAGLSYPERDSGPISAEMVDDLIAVNFSAAIYAVNGFLPDLEGTPGANCVGVGSIAAARARRINSIYGACKRGLEYYFEAVRHYLVGRPCRVQFYRVGYMKTTMTAERRLMLPAASPEWVARQIVSGLGRDQGTCYLPRWWRWVMLAYKLLPWSIFRRLNL